MNFSTYCRGINFIIPLFYIVIGWLFIFSSQIRWIGVNGEENKIYHMESLCKNHFFQSVYRKIDGAVLLSQNERNLDCAITFQTHSILQRFMLRFDFLQLDCNDHLYIYDGAHAVGVHKYDVSCRNTKQTVGSIFTQTNFVTLKYVTDNWGTDSNGFKLVIAALKDPQHSCKAFRCTAREYCISNDLKCDQINHCDDGSDEKNCEKGESHHIFGMDTTWMVLIIVCGLSIFGAFLCGLLIYYFRKTTGNNTAQSNLSTGVNGSTKHMNTIIQSQQKAVYPIQTSNNSTLSENFFHPAGPLGCYRKIHEKLLMIIFRPMQCLTKH